MTKTNTAVADNVLEGEVLAPEAPVVAGPSKLKQALVLGAGCVAMFGVMAVSSHAGTDNTFSASLTTLTDWTQGSLGKILGVSAVAVAMIGAVAKFDWRLCGGAAAVGLMAATGPQIVSSMATALF